MAVEKIGEAQINKLKAQLELAFSKYRVPKMGGDPVTLGFIAKNTLLDGKWVIDLMLPTFALPFERELALFIKERSQEVIAGQYPVELNVFADVKPAVGKGIFIKGVSDIRNVILVASGKGGVGKSTVASNLAVSLAKMGCQVGLLDADVYGPSVPRMMGVSLDEEISGIEVEGHKAPFMLPPQKMGVKLMSLGFMVDAKTALAWRGPMIASAAMQMFHQVAWGYLDYLIVDMPPGTGDIQLSIAQKVSAAGAILVSTPQNVALDDVQRAKAMFDRVGIPTLGLVENMSYFLCDGCDKKHFLFGENGGSQKAKEMGWPLLSQLPLDPSVMQGAENGKPVAYQSVGGSGVGKAYQELAQEIAVTLAIQARTQKNNPNKLTQVNTGSLPIHKKKVKKAGALPVIG